MRDLSNIFGEGSKVVISPDKMRAWVMLSKPASGVTYKVADVEEWLQQNDVVYGADPALIKAAISEKKYLELLEVARGDAPVAATGGGYKLRVEKKPFTGLSGNPDGSLHYEDLSFLQEVAEGTILAEIIAPTPGIPGKTVTGDAVEPKEADEAELLQGSGYVVTDEGRYYRAPSLSHIGFVNHQLIVTPLKRLEKVTAEDGAILFEGNILVEEDIHPGAQLSATGSIYVKGKTGSANLTAGRNILLCGGMRAQQGVGSIEAKENVWGLVFESVDITAGGDLCANHLMGCEVTVQGRANILGGRAQVANTDLYAKNGVVAGKLGSESREATSVAVGMGSDLIDRAAAVEKRTEKLMQDIQVLSQNMVAVERINRNRADKGRSDPQYLEMSKKRDQLKTTLNILSNERTRLKRAMDQFSVVNVIARESVWPGLTVTIDTRVFEVSTPLERCKFKRDNDVIEVVALNTR